MQFWFILSSDLASILIKEAEPFGHIKEPAQDDFCVIFLETEVLIILYLFIFSLSLVASCRSSVLLCEKKSRTRYHNVECYSFCSPATATLKMMIQTLYRCKQLQMFKDAKHFYKLLTGLLRDSRLTDPLKKFFV